MAVFLDDEQFFSYLIQQVLDDWGNLKTVVYDEPNMDLQREMLLYVPYVFIPDYYKYKPTFLKEWIQNNLAKDVTVDNSEVFHIKAEYDTAGNLFSCTIYETINGEKFGESISLLSNFQLSYYQCEHINL
jgi:hypothetical protein